MFHLQLQVLAMLYRTHLGHEKDNVSLHRWMDEFPLINKNDLWNRSRKIVKNFQKSLDFADIVLEGHILGALGRFLEVSSLSQFPMCTDPELAGRLNNAIAAMADQLVDFECKIHPNATGLGRAIFFTRKTQRCFVTSPYQCDKETPVACGLL